MPQIENKNSVLFHMQHNEAEIIIKIMILYYFMHTTTDIVHTICMYMKVYIQNTVHINLPPL